ncbi:cytochrome C assembly family protein [Arenicella chitinivorans]|nr:cytochrome c biogenesis protein CcsA [Arenicella chitinivorans]
MPITLQISVAMALYLVATLLIVMHIRNTVSGNNAPPRKTYIRAAFAFGTLACLLHIAAAWQLSQTGTAFNFGLHSMTTVVSAVVVGIFLLGSTALPIRRLGVLVFPLTIASLLFTLLWDDAPLIMRNTSTTFRLHLLVSICAYAMLALAAVQALLYSYQERQIKHRASPRMLMALPPLQTMEVLLFRLAGMGFVLLTLTLASGAIFSQQIFGNPFIFKHHTILAMLGWLVFATLLYRRVRHGMRGSQAVLWTVGGFLLIQLGYFGTKIVSESLSVQ